MRYAFAIYFINSQHKYIHIGSFKIICLRKLVELMPSFNRTDIKENLPIEFKKFVLAEQIWKLVMKTVLSRPLVRFHSSI
jgi:hypothetical protein